jgi:hypothetical protein
LAHTPGFRSRPQDKFDRKAYLNYVEERLPNEEPSMIGLLSPRTRQGRVYSATEGSRGAPLLHGVQLTLTLQVNEIFEFSFSRQMLLYYRADSAIVIIS